MNRVLPQLVKPKNEPVAEFLGSLAPTGSYSLRQHRLGSWELQTNILHPGIYQFSVIADGTKFPWEKLYFPLEKYGNRTRLTGPWDFDLRAGNRPLVPSYWVELNGKRLGLWHFRRVTLEDIQRKIFRGRFTFLLESSGPVILRLTPYAETPIWISTALEKDFEDCLADPLPKHGTVPLYHLSARRWKELQENLQRPAWGFYRRAWEQTAEELDRGLSETTLSVSSGWNLWKDRNSARDVILYLVGEKMGKGKPYREKARTLLTELLDLPRWGGGWDGIVAEDCYGCDGDLHAMEPLRAAAIALHLLPSADPMRNRIVTRLRQQGRRFLDLALLQRDYWGGCLLQDHGWRSLLGFASTSLLLRGIVPEADLWARFAVPRVRRAMKVFPADGSIGETNYESLALVAPEWFSFRTLWKSVSGENLFETFPQFRKFPVFTQAWNASPESEALTGTNAYLHHLRQEYQDEAAASLLDQIFQRKDAMLRRQSDSMGTVEGLMVYAPEREVIAPQRMQKDGATFFESTGRMIYRDESMEFRLRLGTVTDPQKMTYLTNPNDKALTDFGRGHFHCTRDGEVIFGTPLSPYRLSAETRTCLLVNGKGQRGDIGYPMSLPAEVNLPPTTVCRQDTTCRRTLDLEIDLAAHYPEKAAVLEYSRRFSFRPGGLTILDRITCARPANLAWLFQFPENLSMENGGAGNFCFPNHPDIHFRIRSEELNPQFSFRKTPVVHSYMGTTMPHRHLRVNLAGRVRAAHIEFMLTW